MLCSIARTLRRSHFHHKLLENESLDIVSAFELPEPESLRATRSNSTLAPAQVMALMSLLLWFRFLLLLVPYENVGLLITRVQVVTNNSPVLGQGRSLVRPRPNAGFKQKTQIRDFCSTVL